MMKKTAHYQTLEYDRVNKLITSFALNRKEPLQILDFGCGKGKFLRCFASIGCHATGVDVNLTYLDEARSAGFSAFLPEDLFSSTKDKYDIIFLSHLIEHLCPEQLFELIPKLLKLLANDGHLIIITPTYGERFYHDFSHIKPYLPQSIRHAFGQIGAPISFGENKLIELVDIYFFRDPYRTRSWRSFYVGSPLERGFTRALNACFDIIWKISSGRFGVIASWLGVYRLVVRS